MEKDYTVSTTNQTNKEILFIHTSSNFITETVEINTTNSISKLENENINDNIKNLSSDDVHDNKEIEYVNTISGMSIRNRATKAKLDGFMLYQIEEGNRLPHDIINLASSLLWEERNIGSIEDTGLEWNQFSQ